jgi:hypothetical protein
MAFVLVFLLSQTVSQSVSQPAAMTVLSAVAVTLA